MSLFSGVKYSLSGHISVAAGDVVVLENLYINDSWQIMNLFAPV
jgi:hypothetical protein